MPSKKSLSSGSHWQALKLHYYKHHAKVCKLCGLSESSQITLHHTCNKKRPEFYRVSNSACLSYLVPLCVNHHRQLHQWHNTITKFAGSEPDLHEFTLDFLDGNIDEEYVMMAAEYASKQHRVLHTSKTKIKSEFLERNINLECKSCGVPLDNLQKFAFYKTADMGLINQDISECLLVLCERHKTQFVGEFHIEQELDRNLHFTDFVNRYDKRCSMLASMLGA